LTPDLINLTIGLLLLYGGGEGLVRGSVSLGLRLGMSPLLTGLTIVAFGTSAPELMVSLQAALSGNGSLAVGNVVGSNICNIALILGISTLVRPIEVEARLVRHDVPIMLACSVVLAAMLFNGVLTRVEAGILLTGLLVFIVYSIRDSRSSGPSTRKEFSEAIRNGGKPLALSVVFMVLGIVALVWGGRIFVEGAVGVSRDMGIAPAVIGLSVAAVGTSLPELATSVVAAMRGYGDMAAGNVVGSNIFNTLSVLGLTGMVAPLPADGVTLVDLGVMLMFSVVSLRLLATRSAMERWEGAVLLAGFLVYMAWLFS
jgi:cation:H+ antiporter